MKKIAILTLALVLPGVSMAADKTLTEEQKILYFLGNKVMSRNLKQFDFTAEQGKYIIMGLTDSINNAPAKVDDSYGTKLNEYISKKQLAMMEKEKDKAKSEKEKAKPFIEKMSKEKGAQTLNGGMVLIPIKEGTGATPKATDIVKVHYHGTFMDGKVFDSSVDRGTPAEFPLSQVIPCWTDGVQKLKVGGKAKLVCPSDTAYGDNGMPGAIPGGSTLIFEVELLDIVKPEAMEMEKPAKPAEKSKK